MPCCQWSTINSLFVLRWCIGYTLWEQYVRCVTIMCILCNRLELIICFIGLSGQSVFFAITIATCLFRSNMYFGSKIIIVAISLLFPLYVFKYTLFSTNKFSHFLILQGIDTWGTQHFEGNAELAESHFYYIAKMYLPLCVLVIICLMQCR